MKPKYIEIYDVITKQLDEEVYKVGDMLPTEKELCVIYNASRMTVNKVISMLSQEGRVKRTRGKGTFVIESNVDKEILKLTSFSEDMIKAGKKPGSQLLEYKMKFDVSKKIKSRLQLDDDDYIHVIKRIRTADGEPIAIDIDNVKNSMYNYFENVLKVEITSSDFIIKSILADAEMANHLHVEIGDPILYMKHITYTTNGIPFEYCQTYYRADKYSFSITAFR
ncbi:GntR family transcriptional regulator [Mycoplasmatota bacterium WC44]